MMSTLLHLARGKFQLGRWHQRSALVRYGVLVVPDAFSV